MLTCPKCNQGCENMSAKFCYLCGTAYPNEQYIPFVGRLKTYGKYRLTFAPVEDEFAHEDEVWDAVRHSNWNNGNEFDGCSVEFIESTVTLKTHSYICSDCGEYVTDNVDGKCNGCGETEWLSREDLDE